MAGGTPIRPTVKTGKVGRPGGRTKAMIDWAIQIGLHVQQQQIDAGQVATGNSMRSWVVDVRDMNNVILSAASYYQQLTGDSSPVGRGPTRGGGDGALRRGIWAWVGAKGLRPPEGMTLRQLVWAIITKIHKAGTYLYRNKTTFSGQPPLSIQRAIDESYQNVNWDALMSEEAERAAQKLVDQLVKTGTFKQAR